MSSDRPAGVDSREVAAACARAICKRHTLPLSREVAEFELQKVADRIAAAIDNARPKAGVESSEVANAAATLICDYCGIDSQDGERVAAIIQRAIDAARPVVPTLDEINARLRGDPGVADKDQTSEGDA